MIISWAHAAEIIPAAAAVAAAALQALPNLATAVRGRAQPVQRPDGLRCTGMDTQPPWSDSLERDMSGQEVTGRRRRRRMNLWLLLAALVATAAATAAYLGLAAGHALSRWTSVLAVVVAAPFLVTFGSCFLVIARNRQRSNIWRPRSTRIDVCGEHEIIREHCLTALLGMGARIVCISSDEIIAATGVSFLWFWLGNRVAVKIYDSGSTTVPEVSHTIILSSTKLDYITTNRARGDLLEFRSSWVFTS